MRLPLEEFSVEIPGLFLRISKIYLSNFIFGIFLIDIFWAEKLLNNRAIGEYFWEYFSKTRNNCDNNFRFRILKFFILEYRLMFEKITENKIP